MNWKDELERREPKVIPPAEPKPCDDRPSRLELVLFTGLAILALVLLFYIPITHAT